MIKLEKTRVVGWEPSIRGMRNPMNSWDKTDSETKYSVLEMEEVCPGVEALVEKRCEPYISLGPNDHSLMMKLRNAGTDHRKFMRMLVVYVDITAPLYWWKEFDTYKVGTVANSCSTMHKIHAKEFTLDDFSCEKLFNNDSGCMEEMNRFCSEYGIAGLVFGSIEDLKYDIEKLNIYRQLFIKTKDKTWWEQMIQRLPTNYNQKRTVMLNYEVLANMYKSRKNHKLDEWHVLCDWIEELPYSELIVGEAEKEHNPLAHPERYLDDTMAIVDDMTMAQRKELLKYLEGVIEGNRRDSNATRSVRKEEHDGRK